MESKQQRKQSLNCSMFIVFSCDAREFEEKTENDYAANANVNQLNRSEK